jgi:digeranylgeranylglycerophospholipid reductase
MRDRYDLVVVGAGPVGSTLARLVAENGFSVLILEKDREVGLPVRCAEAVSNRSITRLVDMRPVWIAATIGKFRFNAPDGTQVLIDLGESGYVLHRKLFDADLAAMACDAGAHLITKACVNGLDRAGDTICGVKYMHQGKQRIVRAAIVAGTDGVESRVGRWAGIDTATSISDMESCAQYTLSGVDGPDNICDFYFGNVIAPEGYLWVFPKGNKTANVGIGISGSAARTRSASAWLRDFVQRRMPDAGVLTTIAGGVPCAITLEHIVKGNVVLAGDAAHQVNPLSGGGITSGMRAAELAAHSVVQALRNNDIGMLRAYEKDWEDLLGAKHRMYHRIKEAVHHFPDDVLNRIASTMVSLPPDKHTVWHVLKVALTRHPTLIWDMIKTFGLKL